MPDRGSGRLRLRALLLVFVAQAVLVAWVADSEIARSVYLICYSLMMPTVLYLLLARLLRRWLALEREEVLLGYIVLTATIPILGFGGLRFLIPGLGFLTYFGERQPQWVRYLPHLPGLPVLHDARAATGFFRGESSVPWSAWAWPIAFWSAYLLLLAAIWLALALALHRVWIDRERLTFPMTVLPLQLTDPRDDLLRRPLFWLGFAIPAVLQSLLAIHDWAPAVPAFQLKAWDAKPLWFTAPPWDALPDMLVGFYPMAVGIAYFVPSSVSFSCWFFWLVTKFSSVPGVMLGLGTGGMGAARFPFREEQAAGAWIVFAAMALFRLRIADCGLRISGLFSNPQSAIRNPQSAAAVLALLAAGMMTAVGVPFLGALGVLAVYIAYVITGARVRAEAGGPWTFAPLHWTPFRVVDAFSGGHIAGERGFLAAGHFDLIHVDIRAQSLPYLLEGFMIADRAGIPVRVVATWVMVGTVTALALGWWASLTEFHTLGAATSKSNEYAIRKGRITLQQMDAAAKTLPIWDWPGLTAMAFGGGLTLALAALRTRLAFFPLHPVGYVLANTLTVNAFFVPFFLAWFAKVLVQRFGGNPIYRRSLAFFVGLILGDIVTQAGWTLIGGLLGVPIYQFLS
jgi:hypothetical protein